VQQLHQKAEQVLRGTGNHAGRGRLNSNIEFRPTYHPRGLVLSSGEDTPRGHSLNARLFICDSKKGDIDLAALTRAQEHGVSGLFAEAMSSYVSWLAPQIVDLKKTLPRRLRELRTMARTAVATVHDRTPEAVASLALGWETFLRFALEVGAIDTDEQRRLWDEGWEALLQSGKTQRARQEDQEATNRFLNLLRGAIASGRAHVASAESGEPPATPFVWGWRALDGRSVPQGRCVGWLDGADLYLEPEAAFAAVQTFAQEQGATLPWSPYTTWQCFKNKGLLESHGENRSSKRVTLRGQRRYVIHIAADLVVGAPETDENDADEQTQDVA
jgi:hypothetical protein